MEITWHLFQSPPWHSNHCPWINETILLGDLSDCLKWFVLTANRCHSFLFLVWWECFELYAFWDWKCNWSISRFWCSNCICCVGEYIFHLISNRLIHIVTCGCQSCQLSLHHMFIWFNFFCWASNSYAWNNVSFLSLSCLAFKQSADLLIFVSFGKIHSPIFVAISCVLSWRISCVLSWRCISLWSDLLHFSSRSPVVLCYHQASWINCIQDSLPSGFAQVSLDSEHIVSDFLSWRILSHPLTTIFTLLLILMPGYELLN